MRLPKRATWPSTTDFRTGYAPSNLYQIYWTSKVAWFASEHGIAMNRVGGIGVTYCFSPSAPSPFLVGGLGYSSWATLFDEDAEALYRLGLAVGAGYELSHHCSIEGSLSLGIPERRKDGGWRRAPMVCLSSSPSMFSATNGSPSTASDNLGVCRQIRDAVYEI